MPNCVVILFGDAFIQINYEHMQKQERTNTILITDYVVAIVSVANLVILSLDLVTSSPLLGHFSKAKQQNQFLGQTIARFQHSSTNLYLYLYLYRSVNSPL